MADHRSFEDEIADELQHLAGPEPPVDPLGVARTVSAQTKQRSRSKMLTFMKVATVGLVLAVAGSVLAGNYLGTDTAPPGPGAEAPPAAPVEFQATWLHGPSGDESMYTSEEVDGVVKDRNAEFVPSVARSGDPRLKGRVTVRISSDSYGEDGPDVAVKSFRIENDDGAWQERPAAIVGFPGVSEQVWTSTFDGEGDYEGLVAVAEVRYSGASESWSLHGYIFDGDLPPAPEYGPGA